MGIKKNINSSYRFFNKILLFIAFKGVKNEIDESKQKYIILLNLLAILTCCVNAITAILFFCINDFLPGLMMLVSGLLWLFPIYLNRNGLTLASRIFVIALSNGALLIASCWFSHDTKLDTYFLIVAINCNFMFTTKEKKWLMIAAFISLTLFIIESTSLQNYLPSYNWIKSISKTNHVLLVGQILMILLDVMAYIYVNSLRERNLLEKQKLLEEAQQQVVIQNEDLKTFSIAASHSMQTPLHVSRFFLGRINENGFVKNMDSEHKKYLNLIENGLTQIEHLVSGLFSYNRIINLENEQSLFDVEKEINRIQKFITPRYPGSIVHIPTIGKKIVVNKMLFSIIIQNLIDNGLKYNRSEVPEVKVDFNTYGSELELLVQDNGVGIPQVHFETIFIPFKRVQNVRDEFSVGNGLGLAGAKRAAERMGGSLLCMKSSESGTVFKLRIPTITENNN